MDSLELCSESVVDAALPGASLNLSFLEPSESVAAAAAGWAALVAEGVAGCLTPAVKFASADRRVVEAAAALVPLETEGACVGLAVGAPAFRTRLAARCPGVLVSCTSTNWAVKA